MNQTKAQVDKLLTNVSKGYFPQGYIGDSILPLINNRKQSSGLLGGYGTGHLRVVNTIMAGEGKAPRVTATTVSTTSYLIEDHGLEGLVTQNDYDNFEEPFDAEKDETEGLTSLMKIAREYAIAAALTSSSVLTQYTTLSGTSQFSDYANSDPIAKFLTAKQSVYSGCGVQANTVIMSQEVFDVLSYHPALLELGFQQNRMGQLTEQELAKVLKVEKILIGSIKYESAALGQTSSLGSIWGKHIIFAVLPNVASKKQVSLGYTIRKSGEQANQVFTYFPGNPPNSKAIIVTDNYDDLISNVYAGYLIKDAVA
jgi:hypothetical protein